MKKVTPTANGVITTANKEISVSSGGFITSSKDDAVATMQRIVSVGDMAEKRGFKPGMLVILNFNRYMDVSQKKDAYNIDKDEIYNAEKFYVIPQIMIDGVEHLKVFDNDIDLIIDEYEEISPNEYTEAELKRFESSGIESDSTGQVIDHNFEPDCSEKQ